MVCQTDQACPLQLAHGHRGKHSSKASSAVPRSRRGPFGRRSRHHRRTAGVVAAAECLSYRRCSRGKLLEFPGPVEGAGVHWLRNCGPMRSPRWDAASRFAGLALLTIVTKLASGTFVFSGPSRPPESSRGYFVPSVVSMHGPSLRIAQFFSFIQPFYDLCFVSASARRHTEPGGDANHFTATVIEQIKIHIARSPASALRIPLQGFS